MGKELIFGVLSSVVGVCALIISIANARYSRKRDQGQEIEKLRDALSTLQTEHAVTQKQISLFWGVVEKGIGNMLHSPHREELDRLIEKNARRELLKPDEIKRFSELLDELAKDPEVESSSVIVYKAAVLARHAHVNH